jgi:hypothetical protein
MEILAAKDTQAIEDKALKIVNIALLESDLKKSVFGGARFSLINLFLTTGLHDNAELEGFHPMINKALEFIGPCTTKLSEQWTKFLLYGVLIDTIWTANTVF